MVEQLTLNQRVQGSSPCRPTKRQREAHRFLSCLLQLRWQSIPTSGREGPGFESLQTDEKCRGAFHGIFYFIEAFYKLNPLTFSILLLPEMKQIVKDSFNIFPYQMFLLLQPETAATNYK